MTVAEQLKQRLCDLVLTDYVAELAEVVHGGATPEEREAAIDIHHKLAVPSAEGANATGVLTKAQRGLLFVIARKLEPGFGDAKLAELIEDRVDPAERNKGVPRGREVPLPEVLRVLPLKPPGRGGGVKVL